MRSWRLWQQVSRPHINNPIVKRLGNTPKSAPVSERTSRLLRLFWVSALIGLIVIVMNPAQIFVLLFVLPMLLITLVVSAPLLLPLVTLLAGAYLVAEVIGAIAREKHQHTYELICACTEGALHANWSCATGIMRRGGWFRALRWGTSLSLRIGLIALGGLTALMLGMIVFDQGPVGAEQLRLLLVYLVLLFLYGTQLPQTLLLSMFIGLYAGSFDWFKRDALLIGTLLYVFSQALPMLFALLAYVGGNRLLMDAHQSLQIGMECGSLLLVALVRELIVVALWGALRRRLNESSATGDYGDNRGMILQTELSAIS